MTEVKKSITKALYWVKYVEFGGAVMVVFVLGLLLGELSESTIENAAAIFRTVAGASTVVLGCATVFFVQYDKRKMHSIMIIGSMAAMVTANVSFLLNIFIHPVVDMMISFGSLLFLIILLQVSIDGYNKCRRCDTREEVLNKKQTLKVQEKKET